MSISTRLAAKESFLGNGARLASTFGSRGLYLCEWRITMQDDFVALFAYDRWANRKVLDACRKLTAEQYVAEPVPGWSSVRSTVYHIALVAKRPWCLASVD